jgi:hypothetical protein
VRKRSLTEAEFARKLAEASFGPLPDRTGQSYPTFVEHMRVPRGFGFLYVIELVGVGVKYGFSTEPLHRLRQHATMARNHAVASGRVWLSAGRDKAAANEREFKRRHRGLEYLHGADFETVIRRLTKLPRVRELVRADNIASLPESGLWLHG